MWRPKNWKNPYKDKKDSWEHQCFERGADAILEALVRQGDHIDIREWIGNCSVPFLIILPAKGTIVFIPDKEVGDGIIL